MRLQIQEQIVSSAVGEIIWFIGIELHNIHRRLVNESHVRLNTIDVHWFDHKKTTPTPFKIFH